MGFMDNVTTFTKGVGAKAKGNYDVVALNSQINSIQKEIIQLYGEIGKRYYELFKDNSAPELQDIVNEVNGRMARIDEIQGVINVTKETLANVPLKHVVSTEFGFCSSCGAPLTAEAAFCTKCGARMVTSTVKEDNSTQTFQDEIQQETDVTIEVVNSDTTEEMIDNTVPDQQESINVEEAIGSVEPAVIFCSNCGAQIREGAIFCSGCGKSLN